MILNLLHDLQCVVFVIIIVRYLLLQQSVVEDGVMLQVEL